MQKSRNFLLFLRNNNCMKMNIKSEDIFEISSKIKNNSGFYKSTKKLEHGIAESNIKILNEEVSKKVERDLGSYISFLFNDLFFYDFDAKEYLSKQIRKTILKLVKENELKCKKILVVGLGNEKFACDSLGKNVVDRILITKPYLERDLFDKSKMAEIYALSLGVYGTTGLDTSKTIKSVCQMLKPDLVIAIDSLVAGEYKKLAKSVQISDTKLLPGGGVGNDRQEISEKILGVKVFTIGVPLVAKIDYSNNDDLIVAPKDVEQKVSILSKIIAKGINLSFCKLTEKEYLELTM